MTDKQETTHKDQGSTFDFACCGDGSKLKPDQMNGCDCAGMMSRMMDLCSSGKSETGKPEAPAAPDTTI